MGRRDTDQGRIGRRGGRHVEEFDEAICRVGATEEVPVVEECVAGKVVGEGVCAERGPEKGEEEEKCVHGRVASGAAENVHGRNVRRE